LVRLGRVPLTKISLKGQDIAIYSEEWIDGKNLNEVLASSGTFDTAEGIALAYSVNLAIEELWRHAQIHRDVKPGNIMRTEDGRYVLLDLGLVFDLSDKSLSGLGALHGTIPFFSPEQTDFNRRRHLDFRSDLFALGTTLYFVTTGQHAFWRPGTSFTDTFDRILNLRPPLIHLINPLIHQEFSVLVDRLMEKEPHLRFRTSRALASELDRIADII
jgi:serine/threonine protein kinase